MHFHVVELYRFLIWGHHDLTKGITYSVCKISNIAFSIAPNVHYKYGKKNQKSPPQSNKSKYNST